MPIDASAEIMGMPVRVRIVDAGASRRDAEAVFAYLRHIDCVFSTYKPESETERISRGELSISGSSMEMRTIVGWCELTKAETGGYFDAWYRGRFDPSGAVKGYAIEQAAHLLRQRGFRDFFVEAGGDIQTAGRNGRGDPWRVGIRSPFNPLLVVNVIRLSGQGIATSGTYERGTHIYDPIQKRPAADIASLSVIARNVFDADRFATAAFAMGLRGIRFVEDIPGMEAYAVTRDRQAFCTTGFPRYVA